MPLALRAFAVVAVASTGLAAPVVQLDPWGDDSVRIRIAEAGTAIVDPPLMALGSTTPPPSPAAVRPGPLKLSNGNLDVEADPATGFVTATRISDGAVLLRQSVLTLGAAAPGSRPGSVSVQVSFAGTTGEAIYGLGEHRTGKVNQMPYFQLFQNSQFYPDSHGSDGERWRACCVRQCSSHQVAECSVSIPYYSSSLGYGFLWNLPSYGWVNITEREISWLSNATLNAGESASRELEFCNAERHYRAPSRLLDHHYVRLCASRDVALR